MMKLEDLDLNYFEKLQKNFGKLIDTVVYIINEKGEIISKDREFPFFCQLVMKYPETERLCKGCRIKYFMKLKDNDVVKYKCVAGLYNLMAPIKVFGNILGAIVIGCMKNGKDDEAFKELSERSGISYEEFVNAFDMLKEFEDSKIERYKELLLFFSKSMPELLYFKSKREKQLNRLRALYELTSIFSSLLETKEIANKVLEFIIENLNAYAASLVIFNEEEKRFFKGIKAYDLIDFEKDIIKRYDFFKSDFIDFGKIKSFLYFPLKTRKIFGAIFIYGNEKLIEINKDDLDFLNAVIMQAAMAISNAEKHEEIKKLAVFDKLTGLHNRRYFFEVFEKELNKLKEKKDFTLSVAILDVDDFRNFNNVNGHPAGDRLLKELGKIVRDILKDFLVARYGGEEFIVLMPEVNSYEAREHLEKLRKTIEKSYFEGMETQPNGKVTVSIGFVTVKDPSLTIDEIIRLADNKLYYSKKKKKNAVSGIVVVSKQMNPIDID